eukprot:TRINITY_DN632_c4_g1_i1.p1 TRINITY_DN632_c4_g1~~TRINITY_DN632_c4_g1_i1.p1  ORF type:complete len:585 (+),score=144.82 TRINITY_DN632_c4_g1_i1:135-1889(+)
MQRSGEAAWRDAWEASTFLGEVALEADEKSGGEKLIISCSEVVTEHGRQALIVDDGRTVGISVGDRVAFGVIAPSGKQRSPVAVNVWRVPKKRKVVDAEAKQWEEWGSLGGDFNYAQDVGGKKAKKEAALTGKKVASADPTQSEQSGVVKSQSNNSGNYFVQCAASEARWGRDVTIRYYDMPPGVGVGDAVRFWLQAPTHVDYAPTAYDVHMIQGEEAEAIKQQAMEERRAAKGKGKGKGGSKGYTPSFGLASRGPSVAMTGIVKKKSANTGRHFIFCQDISDVYGADAQIPNEELELLDAELKCGDRISFEIDEIEPGSKPYPLARNIKVLGRGGSASAGGSRAKIASASGFGLSAASLGDGEDADGEIDDLEDIPEPEDEEPAEVDEPRVTAEDGELDDDDRLEAGEEAEVTKKQSASTASTKAKGPPEDAPSVAPQAKPEAPVPEKMPTTMEEWKAAQSRLFGHLPKLPEGWIRMKSKSKGLLYFYNWQTGESSKDAPPGAGSGPRPESSSSQARAAAPAKPAQDAGPEPQSVAEWAAAQERLFGHMCKLPAGWIRMRSKSKGLIYFYNTTTGQSTKDEPR